ncbi:ATPase [Roseivivax halodurans JCM 10272]|uniref:ATPase n=1 Tax=Roseivivax halodurans JCM 10272 TaxID=1449350 RepID=X7EKN5_9RHOB|nr:AAA family ATPase [Roseivivax halodurans]ETX16664.1 ATPase [Roseivivax halodurans JCM 10272]
MSVRDRAPHRRFFLITGAPGGGASALIEELAARGFATIRDPARIDAGDRVRSPATDPVRAAEAAVRMAVEDHARARTFQGPVFFDRGLIDALVARQDAAGGPFLDMLVDQHPYANPVIFALPPRPVTGDDDELARRTDSAQAADRLAATHRRFGYRVLEMPDAEAAERADWLLARLAA